MGSLAGIWTGLLFGAIMTVGVGLVFGPLSGGPLQGARVMQFLEEALGNKTFEQTWLPIKIIAATPFVREEVVFESGRLAEAVRASISIPGIFKPVTIQGRICLDGGVTSPIPVAVLKQAGANRVIAVNVFPTTSELRAHREEALHRRAELEAKLASRSFPIRLLARIRQEITHSLSPLIFDVIMRSMQSMEHQIAEVACHEADLTLRPTIPGSHWLEFYSPQKFIKRGEEEVLRQLPALRRLVGLGTEPPALTTPVAPGTIPSG